MDKPGSTMCPDAPARVERRLLRRRHGPAEPARRVETESVAEGPRRRDDVRQRRQFRSAARRARRAAAGRRAEVRTGACAKRGGGASRAVVTAAHPRVRAPVRAHGRQPPALDDGALQRRLPRSRGRAPGPARLHRARVAGLGRQRDHLCRVRGRLDHARGGGGRRGPVARSPDQTRLARTDAHDSPCGRRRHCRLRCGHHRSGELLHQHHAAAPRAGRPGSAPAGTGPGHPDREPAHGRARHEQLQRWRRGAPRVGGAGPPSGRGRREHGAAAPVRARADTARSTRSRSRSATCPRVAKWWKLRCGTSRLPGTIAAGSLMPCGRCWRSACSD